MSDLLPGPDMSLIQHKAQAYDQQVQSPGQGHAQSGASTQQQASTCMKGGPSTQLQAVMGSSDFFCQVACATDV